MSPTEAKQTPLQLASSDKRAMRAQFGVLPFRIKNDSVQVLLITTRKTGRWVIPKGWPMDAKTPAQSAAQEALEEAGVKGITDENSIGFYVYNKTHEDSTFPCMVTVFPMHVEEKFKAYREQDQRRRKWFSKKKAASMVWEPELKRLIKNFKP